MTRPQGPVGGRSGSNTICSGLKLRPVELRSSVVRPAWRSPGYRPGEVSLQGCPSVRRRWVEPSSSLMLHDDSVDRHQGPVQKQGNCDCDSNPKYALGICRLVRQVGLRNRLQIEMLKLCRLLRL